MYITIGGVPATPDEAREALAILLESRGVMIRQPLARAGNRLAGMDYHAVADEERRLFPRELTLPPGTHRAPTPHEKTAVIHHLRRRLAE